MVHLYSTYELINQFEIGYIINPSLYVNKVFIEQVGKCLNTTFDEKTMLPIRYVMKNKNTCVIALIMFYDNKGKKPKKVYPYSLIENYVCIDYLSCQPKTLSSISSNRIFEQASYNILLDIGIPEILLNLVSCHGFTEKPNAIIILNCQSSLVNNYLEKGFLIIEKESKQLKIIPNDVKLRINAIDQLETYFYEKKTQQFTLQKKP